MLNLNNLSSAYLALVEKLEWRTDLFQVSQSSQIPVNALGKTSGNTHDTRRYPRVIRSSFQRIVSHYLFSVVSLGPPNVVVQIRDHQCIAIIKPSTEQASSKTEREGRVEANRRAELTLLSLQKSREFIPERE